MIEWKDIDFPPINLWNNPQDKRLQNPQVKINSLDVGMIHSSH